MILARLKKYFHERLIQKLLFVNDTPRSKAGGVALGTFVAFIPVVGLQMPISFAAATLVGVNPTIAAAMACLTNPVTAPIAYYVEYRVGAWLLGLDAISSKADFTRAWDAAASAHAGFWGRVTHLAADIGTPLFVGALPVALALALLSWPLARRLCARRREDDVAAASKAAALLLLPCLLLAPGCTEPRDRYTTRGSHVESRTEGELALFWGFADPQTLAVVAPYHASDGRDRTLQSHVQALTRQEAPRRCLSLSLFRFAAPGSFALADSRSRLALVSPSGRVESLAPSEVLASVSGAADRALLSAQLAAGGVPELGAGQSLRLLVVLPGEVALEECSGVTLHGKDREVELQPLRAAAVQWDEFRSQPSREKFDALVGLVAAKTTQAEESRDDGDSEQRPDKK